jgi:hypothetical protein
VGKGKNARVHSRRARRQCVLNDSRTIFHDELSHQVSTADVNLNFGGTRVHVGSVETAGADRLMISSVLEADFSAIGKR